MSITLSPALEALVEDRVKSGFYENSEEVLRQSLLLLKDRDAETEKLREMIQEGLDDLDQGRYEEYDESTIGELVADVGRRGRERLAEEARILAAK